MRSHSITPACLTLAACERQEEPREAGEDDERGTEQHANAEVHARPHDLVYGLINVRTDGERVMCGYMKEGSQDFELQLFRGGVEP